MYTLVNRIITLDKVTKGRLLLSMRIWKSSAERCNRYKARVKRECFALYDSRCVRCGYDDARALQLDHVHSNPTEARGQYGRGSTGLYLAVLKGIKPQADYQCLCANCNMIKRLECPVESPRHKRT